MTMTPERLAELDAVMAKATKGMWAWDAGMIPPDGPGRYADIYVLDDDREPIILAEFNDNIPQGRDNAAAIVALHNAYPDLKAHIAALEAEVERLREANGILERALRTVGDDYPGSSCQKWCREQLKAARAVVIVTGAA